MKEAVGLPLLEMLLLALSERVAVLLRVREALELPDLLPVTDCVKELLGEPEREPEVDRLREGEEEALGEPLLEGESVREPVLLRVREALELPDLLGVSDCVKELLGEPEREPEGERLREVVAEPEAESLAEGEAVRLPVLHRVTEAEGLLLRLPEGDREREVVGEPL